MTAAMSAARSRRNGRASEHSEAKEQYETGKSRNL
jgi:hypothetical protein